MALSRWFGQPTNSSGSSAASPPSSSDHAKSVAINKAEHKQIGFENFGNTCYINSVLQALYFCYPFRELIIQAHDRSNPTVLPTTYSSSSPSPSASSSYPRAKNQRKPSTAEVPRVCDGANSNSNPPLTGPLIPAAPPSMFSALRSVFVHISGNSQDKGVVAPKAFFEKLKKENELFRSTMHQDAHELLIFLLNKVAEDLEEEAKNVRSGNSSGEDLSNSVISTGAPTLGTVTSGANSSMRPNIVHDLFEGVLTSETRCLTCETVSSRDEAFLDLSIDIEQNSSVTACLRQFSASEMLCHKNKFFCDSCCGLQEAEKRMKIKRLPNVLALHLKRFKFQEDGKYIKLAYRVAFPLELRLFNTADDATDPDRLYELFAIVVHIGNGPHHGHYVAIIKSGDSWLLFDDDNVDTIKESDISKYYGDSNSGAAYVLYYQALDLDLPALGLKVEDPVSTESAARASPTQIPLLPPGLTHEGDSDASEFAPTTPGSPAVVSDPTVVPASPPALNVIIPPVETSSSLLDAVSTPTVASPSAKSSGFFNSLRHSPSKPSFGSGSRNTPQETNSPPVPPLPPSVTAPQLSSEPSEASSSTTSPLPNGRSKSTIEKAGGWFARRRSARVEKERPPDRARRPGTSHSLQATQDSNDRVSFASSSSSSRIPLIPEGPQTPQSSAPSAPASSTNSPALPPTLTMSSTKSSSQDNTPTLDSHPTVPSHELQNGSAISQPLPTINSLHGNHSPNHHRHHSLHHPFHMPSHKKSQPVLSASAGFSESSSTKHPPDARPPKRPSTAGAAISSPTHGTFTRTDESQFPSPPPPVPSLPDGLRSPIARPRPRNTMPSLSSPISKDEQDRRRFSANVFPPSTSTSSSSLKRTSRKLSFTSGMLGFVRKDREKEKEKEKERDRARNGGDLRPSSSFSPASSLTPGVPVKVNGRI